MAASTPASIPTPSYATAVSPAPGSAAGPYIPLPCPSATPASPGPVWPASLPANLPRPTDASIDNTGVAAAGVDITQFRTPESLITSVGTVLAGLRTAGYTVGRGDGEVAEADVPFADASLRGTIRLVGVAPCETVWIVATAKGGRGATYLLPRHTGQGTPATPAALPFGQATP